MEVSLLTEIAREYGTLVVLAVVVFWLLRHMSSIAKAQREAQARRDEELDERIDDLAVQLRQDVALLDLRLDRNTTSLNFLRAKSDLMPMEITPPEGVPVYVATEYSKPQIDKQGAVRGKLPSILKKEEK